MIKYIKLVLFQYIVDNENTNCFKKILINCFNKAYVYANCKYINNYIIGINIKDYLEEQLLTLNSEEDTLLISLSTFLFNVNLIIITVQEDNVNKSYKFNRVNVNLFDSKKETIILCWTFSGYFLLYDKNYEDKIINSRINNVYNKSYKAYNHKFPGGRHYSWTKSVDEFQGSLKNKNILLVKGASCQICKEKIITLIFKTFNNFMVCKKCLQNYINLVFCKYPFLEISSK